MKKHYSTNKYYYRVITDYETSEGTFGSIITFYEVKKWENY